VLDIELLGNGLIYFFTEIPGIGEAMAAWLALVLVGAAIVIAIVYWFRHTQPLAAAIKRRNALLAEVTGGLGAEAHDAREAFATRFHDIDERMMEARHEQASALRRSWEEYRETIVDERAAVIANTARPEHFFLDLGDRQRGLNWFANIFIALGLLITFLGIIGALSTLDFSQGPEAMQDSLNKLMTVAGAKFWASVGGIAASILLRAVDYRFQKRVEDGLSLLCDQLEHGMAYLPPQRIASDQLEQLKQQTPALREFSEQLAIAIEGALEKQMMPMVASLGSIESGIEKISGGGGEAVSKALADGAGAEMAGLADAIGAMTVSMTTMAEGLAAQTGEADRQIEEAVRRFGQASEEMRTAFGELNSNFETIAARMREDSEAASAQSRDALARLIGSLGQSLDEMKSGMATAGEQLGRAATEAANDAAKVGQDALEASFSGFAERFAEVGAPLVTSMETAAGAITTSAGGLAESNRAIGDHARAVEQVAARSADLATNFGTVANDVERATTPVRQSADAIAGAVRSLEEARTADARSAEAARGQIESMAAALEATSASASAAWNDYRERFENVDRALGEATNLLTEATSSQAQNLTSRVGDVDLALGEAIAKLSGALKPLDNLTDTVEELAGLLSRSVREAAE
jgi:ABC-type transporter Mla subunit MlaD|tara:strand:+ start:6818 stop:8743 length:1926 start_codon:yes stop_codon:yes gene_type:complete